MSRCHDPSSVLSIRSAVCALLVYLAPTGAAAGADWTVTLRNTLGAQEYEASLADSVLQSPNRAQGLRVRYHEDRIEVTARVAPTWTWRWRTLAVGRPGALTSLAGVAPRAQRARVAYERGGFVEWYQNSPRGLEQGFTVSTRPPGTGALRIEGVLGDELTPVLRADGSGVDLSIAGAVVLAYDGLTATDARGRALPVRIQLHDAHVALVVDDTGASYPVTVDPMIYSTARHGEAGQDQFGLAVATAGDVNGDGYSDCVVGALDFDGGQTDEGKVYVYYGSAAGLPDTPSWTAEGNADNLFLGASVSTAGDVNGDGFHDLVVGAIATALTAGHAYVWLGSAAGLGASGTPANADWSADGNIGSFFGAPVATASDVNNDGFDDLLVGAANDSNGQSGEGRAYLWLGGAPGPFNPSGLGLIGTTANADWRAESDEAGAAFGGSLASAHDVNADGYDDVVIGCRLCDGGNGRAFAWYGSASDLGADGTPANADWVMSAAAGSHFGDAVAGAGDVTGDGYADVIIGAPLYSNGQTSEGWFGIYVGSASGLSLLPPSFFESNDAGALLGDAVATAGDVNGDGYADVIVGAPAADGVPSGTAVGRAFVYEGAAAGLSALAPTVVQGTQTNSLLGAAVATAGDVDGDGYSDVLVGAPFHDELDVNDGTVQLWRGTPRGLSRTVAWTVQANVAEANLGWSIAGAGDVNGDGYSDMIVGAPHYDAGEADEGVVFLYLGGPAGLNTAAAWTAQGNQVGARMGWSVSGAGDVNGDGYSDVVVGAEGYAATGTEPGAAFVWLGGPTDLGADGTPANADWSCFGSADLANLGVAVADAGDLNGDGYGDVVVGAPREQTGAGQAGRVYVFYGSASGLPTAPSWTGDSDQPGSEFGKAVAAAGDVNRDGFGDLLVGARLYTDDATTQAGEGWVFLWLGGPNGLGAPGLPGNADWTAQGDSPGAWLGASIVTAGDVNADGYSDVLVGAPGFSEGLTRRGRAVLWSGGPAGVAATPAWQTDGDQAGVEHGYAVACVGDVNGDGYGDVAVGAPRYSNGQSSEGHVVIYLGGALGPSTSPLPTLELNQSGALFGYAVAGAGDVNGDGRSDVVAGAPFYEDGQANEGHAFCFLGNGGDGLDVIPRQLRAVGSTPIALYGASDAATSFQIRLRGRTAAGRGRVRIQVEIERYDADFDGAGLSTGGFVTTAAPVVGTGSVVELQRFASGLTEGTFYRWRARTLTDSPYFPRSPWFAMPGNAATEHDLRTGGALATAAPAAAVGRPTGVWLAPNAPNPVRGATTLFFATARQGRVRVEIFNVSGRRITTLADRPMDAGAHSLTWDGRAGGGARVAAGVYVARVESQGQVATRKMLVAP